MPLTAAALDVALNAIQALNSGSLTVSLHTASPASGNVLSGNGYSSQTVAAARWAEATASGNRFMQNRDEINFGDPTGAWAPTHVGVWSGTTLLFSAAVSPGTIDSNTPKVSFPVNALKIGFSLS